MNQTPDKPIPLDIDAQYLFEHFDEIVRVTYCEVDVTESISPARQLEYEEGESLLTPVRLELDLSSTSMRKKKTGLNAEEIGGIELFPMDSAE
jgi:hypothetical protein